MLYPELYDIIIVGASQEGITICNYLISKKPNLKIALVSRNFNNFSNSLKRDNIDYINEEVIYSSYNHGVIGFTFANKDNIFCRNAILATGSKPKQLMLKNSNIYYNLNNISAYSKSEAAVVYGNDSSAATYAIKLAKKFKYVYICSDTLELKCTPALLKKLTETSNIVHLPNCHIINCKNDSNGKLQEITLDTYDTIRCSTLVVAIGRTPEIPGFNKRMIKLDDKGCATINADGATAVIPTLYAVGACATKNSKQQLTRTAKAILTKNNWSK